MNIYNYQANIKVTTTPNGDKVITMNDAIFTRLLNVIFDAELYEKDKNLDATARDTDYLWRVLTDGGEK